MISLIDPQKSICKKYGANFVESPFELKVGVSQNVKDGVQPIHVLRHFPVNGTFGWYIWAGEYSEEPDFFKPLHVKHLKDWIRIALPYLGLEPGYRFLIAENGNYMDVWKDLSLLDDID